MNDKLSTVLLRILPPLAGILAITEIIFINQFVGSGQKILAVDTSIDSMTFENSLLEQQIASASSLVTIEVKSKAMGFTEPTTSQYLTIAPEELPVALQHPQ